MGSPSERHEHDIFELCGGDGRTSKVLIRRRAIKKSRNFDLIAGINLLDQEEVQLVVQVNGKLRAKLMAPLDAESQSIQEMALAEEKVARFTDGKTILKFIIVPNKLVNVVVK